MMSLLACRPYKHQIRWAAALGCVVAISMAAAPVCAADLARTSELGPSDLELASRFDAPRIASVASIEQRGTANAADLEQQGSRHTAQLVQRGQGNRLQGAQSGSLQQLSVRQEGTANEAALVQSGSSNQLEVRQVGSSNSATAMQAGSSNRIKTVNKNFIARIDESMVPFFGRRGSEQFIKYGLG